MTNNGEKNDNKTNKIISDKKLLQKKDNNMEETFNKDKNNTSEINNIKHEKNID